MQNLKEIRETKRHTRSSTTDVKPQVAPFLLINWNLQYYNDPFTTSLSNTVFKFSLQTLDLELLFGFSS
jgi:hypothetical protein